MTEKLPTEVYVIIEGEPFLSRAKEYRRVTQEVSSAWWNYIRLIGADQLWGRETISAVSFPSGKVPKEFTKPDRKGMSYPKKGTDAAKLFYSQPQKPRGSSVFGDAVLEDINYRSKTNPECCGGDKDAFEAYAKQAKRETV